VDPSQGHVVCRISYLSGKSCRIAGLNKNNTAKPDKPIKPTAKQICNSKLFYGKHNFNSWARFI
jgi:hypothetical protein